MKIKIIQLFIYVFFCFSICAQSGEIIYEAKTIPIGYEKKLRNDTISETQKASLRTILKKQPKVLYKLTFNANESCFNKQKVMKTENTGLNFAKIKIGKGVYYTNSTKKKIINQKEYGGQEFLITIPPYKWKLTQEKKQIGKYICYKATTAKYVEGRNGKMERKVIAWYTTQIPYNFGPKEYNGLPGLILELQEDSLLFKATKISLLTDKEIEIEKPVKGKKVTQKEYDSIVKNIILQK
jgi:GLPGLI family protein